MENGNRFFNIIIIFVPICSYSGSNDFFRKLSRLQNNKFMSAKNIKPTTFGMLPIELSGQLVVPRMSYFRTSSDLFDINVIFSLS